MKNITRHFPRQGQLGKPKISVLGDQPWNDTNTSHFWLPFKSLISGYFREYNKEQKRIPTREIKALDHNFSWFNNLVYSFIPSSVFNFNKGSLKSEISDLPDSCRTAQLDTVAKKPGSAGDLLEEEASLRNYKERQGENTECNGTALGDQLLKYFNDVKKEHKYDLQENANSTMKPDSYFNCNRSRCATPFKKRKHCKKETSFISPGRCSLISSNRSFTTYNSGSAPNMATHASTNPTAEQNHGRFSRSIHSSVRVKDNRRETAKPVPKESDVMFEKIKKRNYDWLNSFPSEAVLLQPSRGEFSIRKLISKTTCPERGWGLPSGQSFIRSIGPRINENLVEYMDQKSRIQSEAKKGIDIVEDIRTSQKVKMLINKAREKNREFETKRTKKIVPKPSTKKTFRTVTDTLSLKPIEILKMKEKAVRNAEPRLLNSKKSFFFKKPTSPLRERKTEVTEQEAPKATLTEYQSSASYKDVFQGIFSKSYKGKPSPKTALAVFNRQSAPAIRTMSQRANRGTTALAVRTEGRVQESEKALMVPEQNSTTNFKSVARSPFQKMSNSQLTSKSKASFSTVSKMPLSTSVTELFKKTKEKISFTMNGSIKVRPKMKIGDRTLNTSANSKLTGNMKGTSNEPVIKSTYFSTLGYYPSIYKRDIMKPNTPKVSKPKRIENNYIRSKDNEGGKEKYSASQATVPKKVFFSQRRTLNSCEAQVIKSKPEKDEEQLIVKPKSQSLTAAAVTALYEPLQDQILMEVTRLCKDVKKVSSKSASKDVKKVSSSSESKDVKKVPSSTESKDVKKVSSSTESKDVKKVSSSTESKDVKKVSSSTESKDVKKVSSKSESKDVKKVSSSSEKKGVKKVSSSSENKGVKAYGRCGLEEKKRPAVGRRGLVCRLACILNIGCGGRRSRRPLTGCNDCGKSVS